jgi:hypothetical protein
MSLRSSCVSPSDARAAGRQTSNDRFTHTRGAARNECTQGIKLTVIDCRRCSFISSH